MQRSSNPPANSRSNTNKAHKVGAKDVYMEFVKPVRKHIILGMLMSAASVILRFVPYFVAIILVQRVLSDSLPAAGELIVLVTLAITCALVAQLLFGGGTGVCHRGDAEFRVHARHYLLKHFSLLPLGWFSEKNSSEVKQAVSDDVLGMHQAVAHAPSEITNALLTFLLPLGYLFWVDWRFALAMVGYMLLVLFLSVVQMFRGYSELNERYMRANVELAASSVEMVEGIEVVKTFGGTRRAADRYRTAVDEYNHVTYVWTKLSSGSFAFLGALIAPPFMVVVLTGIGLLFAHYGLIEFVNLVPFLILGINLPSGAVTVMYSMTYLRIAAQCLSHLVTILNVPQLPVRAQPQSLNTGADGDHCVAFEHVSFSYTPDAPLALDDVDITLQPGTLTALVGDSGSGKTTFARLIPRFWDPTTGSVKMSGTDMREADLAEVLEQTSIVFQDSMLLTMSIRENIRISNPGASDEQVEEAARAAQIHDRIMELPCGYDTVIGTQDGNLSGGEAQRVAIARAILHDSPILVLDEATAHSDPENETAIQEALANLARNRTTVVIAHRLNTITSADQILVMVDGRIVEQGTHTELLKQAGRYSKLWKLQQEFSFSSESISRLNSEADSTTTDAEKGESC